MRHSHHETTNNHAKEYGEGVDRMCREQEVNGTIAPTFHTDDFILKVVVTKVTENTDRVTEKLPENQGKVTENAKKVTEKLPETPGRLIEKLIENPDKLIENK